VRKPVFFAVTAALALSLAIVASSVAKPQAESDITVALISDIGKFTDRGFNQNQLSGLNKAKTNLGITALPKASNAVSDYIPNITSAVRQQADLVISAGFLLADATATMAKRFPDTNFAITDYPVQAEPFTVKGKLVTPTVVGLTYAAEQGGCLVGVLAARKASAAGKVIGAVGGIKIPSVDSWIAGYRKCAQMAVPGTKVLIGYSQDFVATDKCQTVAQNQIGQGAEVVFQVAGGCGLGVFKAADAAGKWGIGVDVDQYRLGKRVLTSAVKRVDNGVYQAIQAVQKGTFKGGTNLTFDLKNGGIGLGKMNPAVTAADKKAINSYKARIISGKLKVPSSL
jgi:basic membrane protein A